MSPGSPLPVTISITESIHPRVWYVVAQNCQTNTGVSLSSFEMKFFNNGGFFSHQYSWDDQGLCQMYLVCFVVALMGFVAHTTSLEKLRVNTGHIHPIVWCITCVTGCFTLSVGCKALHWYIYGSDGVGVPFFDFVGGLLSILAQMGIICVSLAIAKGWTVSVDILEDRTRLLALLGALAAAYIFVWIWYEEVKDPALAIYVYDSGVGILIVLLRLAAFGWFAYELHKTMTSEGIEPKYSFYSVFGGLMVFWHLCFPLYVLIGSAVAPWCKAKVLFSLTTCTNCIAVQGLIGLFYPRWISLNFQVSTPDVMTGSNTPYDRI